MPLKTSSQHNILITRFPYESVLAGEEWHTITLAEQLRLKGHHVFFRGSCPILREELAKRGFSSSFLWAGKAPVSKGAIVQFIFLLPFISLYFLCYVWYAKLILRIQVLYMMSLTEKILLTPWAKLLGITVVWVEHQRIGKWLMLNPFRPFYALWSRYVSVVAVSHLYTKDLLAVGIPKNNIYSIVNGVDEQLFMDTGTVWRKKDIQTLRIGYVGRMSYEKGIDILLESLALFHIEHPTTKIECLLLGDGPEKQRLQEKAMHMKGIHVEFLQGYVDIPRSEIPAFYRSLDLFVLPSRHVETFGLVAAEAMMCGVATIVTDVCGVALELCHEEDVYIVRAGDVSAMKGALLRLAVDEELRSHIAVNGRKKALEAFTLERMIKEFERLFDTTT